MYGSNNTNQLSHTLHNEKSVYTNQFLKSATGRFFARVQDDGNFVCYESSDFQGVHAFWASQTSGKGKGPFSLKMQNDGNLVLYDSHNQPTWASDTYQKGDAPYRLVMQNDRNLVIYDSFGHPTWASNTNIEAIDTLSNEKQMDQHAHLVSQSERFYARMQDDGNFVCYEGTDFSGNHAFWASQSSGKGQGPFRLACQNDGNLVIYDSHGQATWASNTNNQGNAPYKLVMQDDRNLVLYDSNKKPIWASNTFCAMSDSMDHVESDRHIQQNGFLRSKNGKFHARMQDDGNLVCYNSNSFTSNNSFWASQTGGNGKAPFKLSPQADGNLCIYDSTGKCTWSSNTWKRGTGPYKLVMQDDRNLVLYDTHDIPTWASGTNI